MLNDLYSLPHGVAKIYREAHEAFASSLNVVAGMGLRAVLEAVCLDRAAKGATLKAKIESLEEQNLVTSEGAEILHKLRFLGNDAAHKMKSPSITELGLAFDVIEHLLLGVYVIPKKMLPEKDPPPF